MGKLNRLACSKQPLDITVTTFASKISVNLLALNNSNNHSNYKNSNINSSSNNNNNNNNSNNNNNKNNKNNNNNKNNYMYSTIAGIVSQCFSNIIVLHM